MFEAMLFAAAAIAILGVVIAFDGSRDVFHPLLFIGPMLAFLYGWMPYKLLQQDGLSRYFDGDQLKFVQGLNVLGVLAFVGACLLLGTRVGHARAGAKGKAAQLGETATMGGGHVAPRTARRLLVGGAIAGSVGLGCWLVTIINVGGFRQAFSTSYSGGWDPSGYVRDGSLLLLLGVLFGLTSLASGGPRLLSVVQILAFGLPWLASAVLMGRRGPTFGLAVVLLMGWYFNRTKRPPLVAMGIGGACLGWLVLFLVTNRSNLYLGSDFQMKDDVSQIVNTADTGNEYIYGTGTVLASERRDHYFWMRRYLAQVLVRPIPSAIWPSKYDDFGVPELLYNAGTGEGFGDALGWVGAPGSAPGIVADLWVEVWWLAVAAMALLGWCYAFVWKRAVERGGAWSTQYIILSALSIYLVMQTMEAVIFRTVMLSVPAWMIWHWAEKPAKVHARRRLWAPWLLPQPRPRMTPKVLPRPQALAQTISGKVSHV